MSRGVFFQEVPGPLDLMIQRNIRNDLIANHNLQTEVIQDKWSGNADWWRIFKGLKIKATRYFYIY